MGASLSILLMKKDSTTILEALEEVAENGSKALELQYLPSLDLSLVESLVSIARVHAGPRLLGQLEHFAIKECRIRLSSAWVPSRAAAAMTMLTDFLRLECRSLQEIDLSRNDLDNDDLAILCSKETGLGAHPTLTSLILRGNRFEGQAGGQSLRHLLTEDDPVDNNTDSNDNNYKKHRAKLIKLDLSENIFLGLHGIQALSLGVAANQQCLQELVLQECLLNDEGVAMLVDSMLHAGRGGGVCGGGGIRVLNLSRNHMSPTSLRSLAKILTAASKSSCCLEVLDVSHNNSLFDEDIRRVESNTDIMDNNNNIDNASCVKIFANALKENRTMHHLNVQHCGIENVGAQYIFRALEFNSTLRVLDIGNPYIKSPAGLDFMIQSIPKMKGLQHVKVFIMSTPSTCK
jgi:Leucine Rich repeat